jgi:hypothetical protein
MDPVGARRGVLWLVQGHTDEHGGPPWARTGGLTANVCKDPAMPVRERPRHQVAVLALEDVVGLELALPHRFLGMAEDGDGRPLYRADRRPGRSAGHDALA